MLQRVGAFNGLVPFVGFLVWWWFCVEVVLVVFPGSKPEMMTLKRLKGSWKKGKSRRDLDDARLQADRVGGSWRHEKKERLHRLGGHGFQKWVSQQKAKRAKKREGDHRRRKEETVRQELQTRG